ARSGIQCKFNIIRLFLDPGSRPALRDLAGMTNYDRAPQGVKRLLAELYIDEFHNFTDVPYFLLSQ
ncbi:MAG: hypothetical protein PVH49_13695, partial [Syntrophobacterales bacterium]